MTDGTVIDKQVNTTGLLRGDLVGETFHFILVADVPSSGSQPVAVRRTKGLDDIR